MNKVCLLETFDCFFNRTSKYEYKHVKGIFGALTLFNITFKKYHLASMETTQRSKTYFIHVRNM